MTTLVFPGQGSQYIGMAKDFYDNFASAKDTFDLVEDATDMNIKEVIFKDDKGLLNITKYTQLCIYTASMAIFNVFTELFNNSKLFNINFVLGHSLGEYSALTASKSISIRDCSKLLKIRGELMQNAYTERKSGMAAIIGLSAKSLENIISENSLKVEIANDNAPEQVVLSGIIDELKLSEKILYNNGAKKIIYLNVSAAFHSKIMQNAEKKLNKSLSEIQFNDPLYSVISNYTAKSSKDKETIYKNLSSQMSNRVKWMDSIKLLFDNDEKLIIEIGPGKTLTGIIKRISKDFTHFNINELKDIELLKNAI